MGEVECKDLLGFDSVGTCSECVFCLAGRVVAGREAEEEAPTVMSAYVAICSRVRTYVVAPERKEKEKENRKIGKRWRERERGAYPVCRRR